jgi:WhiB family transcriptional regulator, redox-sensing transcriptional regulator
VTTMTDETRPAPRARFNRGPLFASLRWQDQAACRDEDPAMFFPAVGASAAEAKRFCAARCPVRFECLAYAIRRGERFGVWGGMSERERRALSVPGTSDAGAD